MKRFNCNCKCAEKFKALAKNNKVLCYAGIAIAVILLCLLVYVSVHYCRSRAAEKRDFVLRDGDVELINSGKALLSEMERNRAHCDNIDEIPSEMFAFASDDVLDRLEGNDSLPTPGFYDYPEKRRNVYELRVPGILQGVFTQEEFRQLVNIGIALYCVPVVLFLLFLLTWIRVAKIRSHGDYRSRFRIPEESPRYRKPRQQKNREK